MVAILDERIQILAKLTRVNPLEIKNGLRQNLFIVNDSTYAVFTEKESIEEIIAYFKEDLNGGSYWFAPKLIQDITGSKDISDLIDAGIVPNTESLRKLIESTCGFETLVKKCLEYNGDAKAYGTYINSVDGQQIFKDGYYIYLWQ